MNNLFYSASIALILTLFTFGCQYKYQSYDFDISGNGNDKIIDTVAYPTDFIPHTMWVSVKGNSNDTILVGETKYGPGEFFNESPRVDYYDYPPMIFKFNSLNATAYDLVLSVHFIK